MDKTAEKCSKLMKMCDLRKVSKNSVHTNLNFKDMSQSITPPVRVQIGKNEASSVVNGKTEFSINKKEEKITKEELESLRLKEKGNQFFNAGEYERAIEQYTKAIVLYDKNELFYTNRSQCYFKLAKYNECVSDCTKAISLNSENIKAYFRRMEAYEKLKLYAEALKDGEIILKINPTNLETEVIVQRIEKFIALNDAAKKSEEAVETKDAAPKFMKITNNMVQIESYTKPVHLSSKKSLKPIEIEEVSDSYFSNGLQITDELIDYIFNSFDTFEPKFIKPEKPQKCFTTEITIENENECGLLNDESSKFLTLRRKKINETESSTEEMPKFIITENCEKNDSEENWDDVEGEKCIYKNLVITKNIEANVRTVKASKSCDVPDLLQDFHGRFLNPNSTLTCPTETKVSFNEVSLLNDNWKLPNNNTTNNVITSLKKTTTENIIIKLLTKSVLIAFENTSLFIEFILNILRFWKTK